MHLDPTNSQALLELADAELSSGDPFRASQDFSLLADNHPEMAKAWEGLGTCYLVISERAREAVKNEGAQTAYWYSLQAQAKSAEGDTNGALRLYQQALTMNPSMPGLHEAVAGLYRENDQSPEALREEEFEAKVNKDGCTSALIACFYAKHDWSRVLSMQEKNPSLENSYWASLAGTELARQSFVHLTQLPASSETHDLLARLDAQSGKRLDAVAEWRKAVALEPSKLELQGRLAKSLFRAREYPEAQKLFEKLVNSEPENVDWLYFLGGVLLRQGEQAEALPYLEKAARFRPDSLPIQENLGRAYLKVGQAEKAVISLERARPLDDDGSISYALSIAYRKLGRAEEARAALERYHQVQQKREHFQQ